MGEYNFCRRAGISLLDYPALPDYQEARWSAFFAAQDAAAAENSRLSSAAPTNSATVSVRVP